MPIVTIHYLTITIVTRMEINTYLIGLAFVVILAYIIIVSSRTILESLIQLTIEKHKSEISKQKGSIYVAKQINRDYLLYFKKFKKIKYCFIDSFAIAGVYKDNSFSYYQLRSYFCLGHTFSVIFLDTEKKYEKNFSNIEIKPQKSISLGKDHDLEWNQFNRYFINKFDNPRQALEVVSPTFMQQLVRIKEKYQNIYVEYFESSEYQKNCLVIYKKGALFPIFFYKKDQFDKYYNNFLEFLSDCIELNKSI